MVDPRTLRRVHELYAADYAFLGYDPKGHGCTAP